MKLGGFELFHCGNCTHRFAPEAFAATPNYSSVYLNEIYASAAKEVREYKDNPAYFAGFATYDALFKQAAAGTVLDNGCGFGRFGLAAVSKGWTFTGIDVSEPAVKTARELGLNATVSSLADFAPAVSSKFDFAAAFEVLEHLKDPVAELNTMSLVAKNVFCTVPNWENDEVQNATRVDWVPPIHLQFFTARSMAAAAQAAGLANVRVGLIWSQPPHWTWRFRAALRRANAIGLWLCCTSGES